VPFVNNGKDISINGNAVIKEGLCMKKAILHSQVLLLLFVVALFSVTGCSRDPSSVFPSSEDNMADQCNPDVLSSFHTSYLSPAIKAGGQSFILKRGWNMVKFPLLESKKFISATMTWQGQTKLIRDAVPDWTQAQIRYLKGRAWLLLSTASLTASFQPGGTYYIYSSKNGLNMSFNRPFITGISPSSGATGNVITISGINFGAAQGAGAVTFGGTSAGVVLPPENWSDTQITCTAPANGVVVVTANGQQSNNDKLYEEFIAFVTIPAGEFMMGQAGIAEPVHRVTLSSYEIGKYEVTNAQFAVFVNAANYHPAGECWQTAGGSSGYADENYPNHPVVPVSWDDAVAFCSYYGYRLPTEAEWEFAARGTDARTYPWGDTWNQDKCNNMNGPRLAPLMAILFGGQGGTLPVGIFDGNHSPALNGTSFYGCMDMAGNVWEWCSDWYGEYKPGIQCNPQGPETGNYRIMRGGSWDFTNIAVFPCADRSMREDPGFRGGMSGPGGGFRVVRLGPPLITDIFPSFWTAGNTVTLMGRDFGMLQGTSTVEFGGASATVTSWNNTSIVCTAPGTGPVVVKVRGRLSNEVPLNFMAFVTIPAGEFTMGFSSGEVNERPPHTVYLDAYRIGKYEVTNAQFEAFVTATGYDAGNWRNAGGSLANYSIDFPNNPVVCVSWIDAMAFCDYYGYRLPTEAEWEKAARGADERIYPWGNSWDANNCNNWNSPAIPQMANFDRGRGPSQVGFFPNDSSPYDLKDTAGNAWEWCSDWYGATYYASSPPANPPGPDSGSLRVVRSGSWGSGSSDFFRVVAREYNNSDGRGNRSGFRVAR
jgi:formylglycine-generating enzyme required for sulfatase activity